jgi:glycosyltransferase involved in cell wall biosynthesis
MGAAIARLGADRGLRALLAEAGVRTLAERFSKEAVVARYLSLFDEIAKDKNGGRG